MGLQAVEEDEEDGRPKGDDEGVQQEAAALPGLPRVEARGNRVTK